MAAPRGFFVGRRVHKSESKHASGVIKRGALRGALVVLLAAIFLVIFLVIFLAIPAAIASVY